MCKKKPYLGVENVPLTFSAIVGTNLTLTCTYGFTNFAKCMNRLLDSSQFKSLVSSHFPHGIYVSAAHNCFFSLQWSWECKGHVSLVTSLVSPLPLHPEDWFATGIMTLSSMDTQCTSEFNCTPKSFKEFLNGIYYL